MKMMTGLKSRLMFGYVGFVVLLVGSGTAQASCAQTDIAGKWNAFGLMAGLGADTAGVCVLLFNAAGLIDATKTKCTGRDASQGGSVTIHPTGSLVQNTFGSCVYKGTVNTNFNTKQAIVYAVLTPNKAQFLITGNIPANPANFDTGGGFSLTAVRP